MVSDSSGLKVGLYLTNQQPKDRDPIVAFGEQLEMLNYVRDNAWDSVWVGHHYLSEPFAMLQPVPFLARLIPEAGDLTVGLGILLAGLHSPVHLAETVATLDVLSSGRLVFGAGLGYRRVEFDAFGVKWSERAKRFETTLRATIDLLEGVSVSLKTDWWELNNACLTVLPIQRPRPPVWIAANNDPAVRRAALLGDAWMINPHADMATVQRQTSIFRMARQAAGRPVAQAVPLMREVFCAATREEAHTLCSRYLVAKYSTYSKWGQDAALPGSQRFDADYAVLRKERFIVGDPSDCVDQLITWVRATNSNHLILRTHWSGLPAALSMMSIRLITQEVIPRLRSSLASPASMGSRPDSRNYKCL